MRKEEALTNEVVLEYDLVTVPLKRPSDKKAFIEGGTDMPVPDTVVCS